MQIKVRVELPEGKYGFINNRRVYGGEEITIEDKRFSKSWMTKLSSGKKRGPKPKQQTEPESEGETLSPDEPEAVE